MEERKGTRLEDYRPVRRVPDEYDAPSGGKDSGRGDIAEDEGYADDEDGALDAASADAQPDVLLDVPALKVDEIHLEVDDLKARVSLEADVLSLLRLHVGADVTLGRVALDIKGVDAVARLKVRLDKVAAIIERVMTTLDNNPEILSDLTRGLGEAADEVGRGAGGALENVAEGAGEALEGVGEGAGSAVGSVGSGVQKAAGDVGRAGRRVVEGVVRDDEDVVADEDEGGVADGVVRQARRTAVSGRGAGRAAERTAVRGQTGRVRRPRPE